MERTKGNGKGKEREFKKKKEKEIKKNEKIMDGKRKERL